METMKAMARRQIWTRKSPGLQSQGIWWMKDRYHRMAEFRETSCSGGEWLKEDTGRRWWPRRAAAAASAVDWWKWKDGRTDGAAARSTRRRFRRIPPSFLPLTEHRTTNERSGAFSPQPRAPALPSPG